MRRVQSARVIILAIIAVVLPLTEEAWSAPAQFWLSDSSVMPAGPSALTINKSHGTPGSLHVWGRPETGKKLRNISLNLIALQAGVDFIDSSIIVHNAASSGVTRYEYVSDSTATPAVTSEESLISVQMGDADSIESLQGFSISASSTAVKGVGDQCVGAETGCVIATDGMPAWLIASVDYNPIAGGPVTELHLQIAEHGMNHESLVSGDYDLNGVVDNDDLTQWQDNYSSTTNLWADGTGDCTVSGDDFLLWQIHLGSVSVFEASSMTTVRFGDDTVDYDAGTDRDITLGGDAADATITIVAPLAESRAVPEPTSLYLLLLSVGGPYRSCVRFVLKR